MTSKNILQRIHAVMGEVDYVQKDKKAGMNYTIVSHDVVTAKVRPILHKHGVVYYPVKVNATQDGTRTQTHLTVRFCNIDEPADFIDVESLGYGIDTQDKGPGKAISYAVKYALLKALGLETGDDPDHDSIEHQPKSPNSMHLPHPTDSQQAWQDFGKAVVQAAQFAQTVPDLLKWMAENKEVFAGIKKASEKLHAYVRGSVEAHLNNLRDKEAA